MTTIDKMPPKEYRWRHSPFSPNGVILLAERSPNAMDERELTTAEMKRIVSILNRCLAKGENTGIGAVETDPGCELFGNKR